MGFVSSSKALSSSWLDRTKIEQIDLFNDYSKYSDAVNKDYRKFIATGTDYKREHHYNDKDASRFRYVESNPSTSK